MRSQACFPRLFEPGQIGGLKVKNRMVMPAMATNYASEDGFVTDRLTDYYVERARGGAGLVIVEVADVQHPLGNTVKRQLGIDHDKFLPGLSRLSQAVRGAGARVALQLHHAGRKAKTVFTHLQPVAPSPIALAGYDLPRELSLAEIADLVEQFAAAAQRAQQAGFDGIELHAGHQYLISSFLSAASNRRTDEYGGSLENRARFLLEVMRAIRSRVGQDLALWCRLSAQEFGLESGITLDETRRVAAWAERASADAIHVSAWPTPAFRFPPMAEPPGTMLSYAAAIKQAVNVPVIAVGRVSPELGDAALLSSEADFIALGRALIADPELPRKLASGRRDDIRPCIGCLHCHGTLRNYGTEDGYLQCSVNPRAGRERATVPRHARKAKRVLVVGGGPAGMEAAITCARRGHEVTLCERQGSLGGQLKLAVVPPHKDDLGQLLQYMTRQLQQLEVEVKLGTEVSQEYVLQLAPEVVLVATGADPNTLDVPGLDSGNLMTAAEVLSGKRTAGRRVVIIGGQLVACETADYLAQQGKQVTVLGRRRPIGEDVRPDYSRRVLLQRLARGGVRMEEHVEIAEISATGVSCRRAGNSLFFPADSVVLAAGASPQDGLARELDGKVSEVHCIGDCVRARDIGEAIRSGFQVALRI